MQMRYDRIYKCIALPPFSLEHSSQILSVKNTNTGEIFKYFYNLDWVEGWISKSKY